MALVFLVIGRESGMRFLNQSPSIVKQNQSKLNLQVSDTQVKMALKADETFNLYYWIIAGY